MKKKIFFVLSEFPVVSHPFLYNQIQEVMRREEYDVKIIIFKRSKMKVHQTYEELNERVIEFPINIGERSFSRFSRIIKSFFLLMLKNPKVFIRSLNFSRYSINSKNFTYLILSSLFLDIDADIVHSHFGPVARMLADLKEIGAVKAKLLSSFHGADITVYPKQYGKKYYERLFQASDLFTGNSRFIISKMVENNCPPNKIVKIPECLNLSQFSFRGKAPERGVLRILTVGRMVEKKGYEYSLGAVALLKKQGIPFIYDIIGDGPLKESILKLAFDLDIMPELNFHGAMPQEKVKSFYETAHIFLLPSVTGANGDTEGQGLVLQEAQAIGLPVLATLHNGFPDSIIDGTTGYLVPEKDAQALFEKLLEFHKDENLCNQMGEKGRQFVEDKFDAKVVINNLIDVYERL